MARSIQSLIEAWDGFGVISRYDAATGVWIFICLHDNTLGPCTGGTRMKPYGSPADGLRDAMRLAEGMTCKWAAIRELVGGGKAVLALSRSLEDGERRQLLHRYGALVESLNGAFRTGEDLGTTSSDMEEIAEKTRYVHGFHPLDGSKVDPSPFTAAGVFSGIRGAAEVVWGSTDLMGRAVLIQGAGSVGMNLGRLLKDAGCRVLVSDLDPARVEDAHRELGAEALPIDQLYSVECDIYAPCAVGATLNEQTIPQLKCAIVAGSSNNQLADPTDGQRLLEAGIVYVPDYIINAGGALSFALMDRGTYDLESIRRKMDSIGTTAREILREAEEHDESPVAAAERRVQATLAEARARRVG